MKSSESEVQLTDQQKIEIQEFLKLRADMKAYLKTLSKNELIRHIFELTDLYNAERSKAKNEPIS